MKQTYFVALAGGVGIGAGTTIQGTVEAARAAFTRVYDPKMGCVQVDVEILPATREAFEAVRDCAAAIARGDLECECWMVAPVAGGKVDLLTTPAPVVGPLWHSGTGTVH
jgi:hypothetical protein